MALIITEVDDATALAGDLFRSSFGQAIPREPRHFITFHRAPDATLSVIAYIHYTAWEEHSWLSGGLCVDPAVYARVDPREAAVWKREGALGEIVLRDTLARLNDRAVIFGYCGHPRQWEHCLKVGYVPCGPPHLLAVWNQDLPVAEKTRLIAKAAALGAF
jgi:hypothetical protein